MKTLAIVQGALGDGIMALWALKAAKDHLGGGLTLIASPALGSLAKDCGLADEAFSIQAGTFSSLYTDTPSQWVRECILSHQVVVVFSFSKLLFESVAAILPSAVQVLPRPEPGVKDHVLDHILAQLYKKDLVEDPSKGGIAEQEKAFDLHSLAERPASAPILIHPGSGSPRKNWPLDHYLQLYDSLSRQGEPVTFVLGPDDERLRETLEKALSGSQPILRPGSLLEYKDIVLGCRAYIGNDSGATHLAAMVGAPTVAIFGPSNPEVWKPVGPRVQVVRPDLACEPCFDVSDKNCDEVGCLKKISLDMFEKALLEKQ